MSIQSNSQVLEFINKFITKQKDIKSREVIYNQFRNGYCYYFAIILKNAFNRGEICIAYPFGHIVWIDDGIPYDIGGVYDGESTEFIPISYLGNLIEDFMHVPGKNHFASTDDIKRIYEAYTLDKNKGVD